MHYNTFPQFKAGLLEAASSLPAGAPDPKTMPDAKIDILFQHYNHARGQASLTVGRLKQTQDLRETQGTAFEGGKGRLLLTPKASGFSSAASPASMTFGKTAVPRGVSAGEWKEWQDGKERTITPADWKKKSPKEQMDTMMGNKWSIWLNDAFILGGIHTHAVFHLVSNLNLKGDSNAQFPFNVTQRELLGLCKFGYSGMEGELKAGTEYKCTDTQLADAATFKSYVEEMLSQESRVRRQAP